MRYPRSQRAAGATAVLCVVSLLAAGTAAAAPVRPTAAGPVPGLPLTAGRPRAADLTLITGDVVHVKIDTDGRYSTRTDLAPRPDGRSVTVQTLVDADHVYVLPSDAAALVAAGRVDRRLFDVRTLLADGDGDAAASTVPVIVAYAGAAQATPPAAARVRALRSVNGSAVSVDKTQASQFWSTVDPGGRGAALGGGLRRVWLDGKVHASLDQSVPMIGAPQAWAAGLDGTGVTVAVLDTGIDGTHPDLARAVAVSQSFVPNVSTARDGNGHGTHVASTIAGSGTASAGKYRGVAPGARLAIGKVLDDSGSGNESSIIDGMQWAATTVHARVISMSLGTSESSDGTDPMSEAVDELTASTGALFVIAAGNSGPGARTVGSPGAADAALTVAAVDKTDHLASFSSRGPRVTDYAMKPDIAAPGVSITAARAAGTSLGTVVDDHYTTLSGTSMATPHVAGAAAILAQEHPDWAAARLKAVLMGTAKDDGYTGYQQGAGRVDVSAAFRAGVVPDTAALDFGRLRYPQQAAPAARTLTYRNDGGQPVTLSLSATMTGPDGHAAPAGMLTLAAGTLTVPAGGSATVDVALAGTLGAAGLYSGAVTATGNGMSLRTPVAGYKEPPGFELTVHVAAPAAATTTASGALIIRRTDQDTGEWHVLAPAVTTSLHLDQGVYTVSTVVTWGQDGGGIADEAVLADPQVVLHADATVTLDAGQARRVEVATDRATEEYGETLNLWQTPAGATTAFGIVTGQLPYGVRPWVLPTRPVSVGTFLFDHTHLVGTPLITARVAGPGGPSLHPRYQSYSAKIRKLDGRMDLPIVYARSGSAADFAGLDVRGKIALIDIGDNGLADTIGKNFPAQELRNAAGAGAAAVFAFPRSGQPDMGAGTVAARDHFPLPVAGLPAGEGQALRDRLRRGPAVVHIESQPTIPDLYVLSYLDSGAIPAVPRYRAADRDLATLRTSFHGDRSLSLNELWAPRRPGILDVDDFAMQFVGVGLEDIPGPMTRTEHVGPVSAGTVWQRSLDTYDLNRLFAGGVGHQIDQFLGHTQTADVFDRPVHRTETWGQAPVVPGVPVLSDTAAAKTNGASTCGVCRFTGLLPGGDVLPIFTIGVDGGGHGGELTTYSNNSPDPARAGVDEWHMYAGGTELAQNSLVGVPGLFPYYFLPAGRATYRLTEHFASWMPQGGYGSVSDSTWTFTSASPVGKEVPAGYDPLHMCGAACRVEPLLFLRYQFDVGLDNRAAPGVHVFTVTAYRQPSTAATPPVAGLRLTASFDGGAHWSAVPAFPTGGGAYRIALAAPRTAQTVTLRVEAWDAAGNRVVQTLADAYGLAPAGRADR